MMKNAKLLIFALIAVAAIGAGALLMTQKKQAEGQAPAETLNDAFKDSAPLTEKPAVDPTEAAPKPFAAPAQPAVDNKAFFPASESQAPAEAAAPTEAQAPAEAAPTGGQTPAETAPSEAQAPAEAAPAEGQAPAETAAPAEGQAPAQPH